MAQRATLLGPKPSNSFCIICVPLFVFNRKSLFLPPKRVALLIFRCLPFVSLYPLFGLLLFRCLVLCLSLVIFFLTSLLFLMSVSGCCFLFLFCLFCLSRCSFVFVFCLLLILFIITIIITCVFFGDFASCFLVVVVAFWFFALMFCYLLIFG